MCNAIMIMNKSLSFAFAIFFAFYCIENFFIVLLFFNFPFPLIIFTIIAIKEELSEPETHIVSLQAIKKKYILHSITARKEK
jgi:hypothetical protein